jgi:hypothetical protein
MWALLVAGTVPPFRGGGGNLFPATAAGNDGATKKQREKWRVVEQATYPSQTTTTPSNTYQGGARANCLEDARIFLPSCNLRATDLAPESI